MRVNSLVARWFAPTRVGNWLKKKISAITRALTRKRTHTHTRAPTRTQMQARERKSLAVAALIACQSFHLRLIFSYDFFPLFSTWFCLRRWFGDIRFFCLSQLENGENIQAQSLKWSREWVKQSLYLAGNGCRENKMCLIENWRLNF